MKFSHNWLNEYLSDTQSSQELADTLTLAGLEVDAIEPVVAEKVTGVVVGQIKTITKHPDADKLNICSVDIGEAENSTIVCGAKNIYEGMKAPVATIGAVLPGNFKIKKSKLRGQESFGMMCSEEELGLAEKADGLMDLPTDAPVGEDVNTYLNLDDNMIEVDLTPNRADCLSVFGIAREVSALTKADLKEVVIKDISTTINDTKEVTITATDACKSYYGCIIKNVNNKAQTPLWIVEKLRRSGVSSISFFVDVTNYIMLLTGQPMHAFDLDKLDGGINIRYANDKEKLTLLDDTKVELESDTLVIADEKKALAIAGVMGGLDSSITDSTTNIFLESAFFVPEKIAGKARKYNLHTDSSHRFERGVDPKLASQAMQLAINLIVEIAGGEVAPIHAQVDNNFVEKQVTISLCINKLNRVLGTEFDISYVSEVLSNLHMQVTQKDECCLEVVAPSYRFDMEIPEDLIEEVARVYGYSKLPETMPSYKAKKINISETKQAITTLESRLVDRGYQEAINYSFIDPKFDEFFFAEKGIAIKNPISQDLSVMRQSLIPGLLNAFKANVTRQQTRVRLFEKGACFKLENGTRKQFDRIAGLAFGELNSVNWSATKKVDFYDVKADIESLCSDIVNLNFEVCDDVNWLHPGQSAYIVANGKKIGVIGVIHPTTLKTFQIKSKAPIIFELDLEVLNSKEIPSFNKISKYPSVSRDVSFLVEKGVLAGDIVKAINNLDISILQNVNIFDVYQDDANPRKSLAISMLFQDNAQTLGDEVINENVDDILNTLKDKFAIEQRV
ncbi:phenylalanine--tRNA ligase subunit beta [Francisella adeliensis]|uniref:Phenylalanine--tRNA ligase beta subunit n=1 Tax=Francisella adeliensis TaxID=2007306 RepID=A0A2Z4XZ24_9GAMM|nr:phenylalanine--tRNA ligase subunit beta [Francisella adeliensis]AXA33898.1 phenylalanine--tRNA ligase subunit beta [Francisella adeliensis]MBK2085801.1 phenylalanine--tRNA ligase subunit beta [Francisella adeliensis]MBK2097679.1 phenylalanine--tRNA ligase subunit beta [Francisella adeliensis]QIW12133.1 phenylalanine--tRNA ligase subunit beta [Francisella adeliensis]QIW14007.1 phenylalanine--tRNA ligase subunit beta [Francisella adeliensis]